MSKGKKVCEFCGRPILPKDWTNIQNKYCDLDCEAYRGEVKPTDAFEVTDDEPAVLQHPQVQVKKEIPVLVVIKPGQKVVLKGNPSLETTVLKATVHMSGDVEYLVTWWAGENDLLEKWVQAGQIDQDARPPEKLAIGFHDRV